eukprot:TRINITY_DN1472_c0_g1_i2.p1 TRINITY_DN1472_c0_g1~~TRINITY_DN1472_c0_g1_i2.p1  ORF type:complete len:729 (+),score=206.12 TRINITY_DN1472_c0_g1_i2:51-2189(+)
MAPVGNDGPLRHGALQTGVPSAGAKGPAPARYADLLVERAPTEPRPVRGAGPLKGKKRGNVAQPKAMRRAAAAAVESSPGGRSFGFSRSHSSHHPPARRSASSAAVRTKSVRHAALTATQPAPPPAASWAGDRSASARYSVPRATRDAASSAHHSVPRRAPSREAAGCEPPAEVSALFRRPSLTEQHAPAKLTNTRSQTATFRGRSRKAGIAHRYGQRSPSASQNDLYAFDERPPLREGSYTFGSPSRRAVRTDPVVAQRLTDLGHTCRRKLLQNAMDRRVRRHGSIIEAPPGPEREIAYAVSAGSRTPPATGSPAPVIVSAPAPLPARNTPSPAAAVFTPPVPAPQLPVRLDSPAPAADAAADAAAAAARRAQEGAAAQEAAARADVVRGEGALWGQLSVRAEESSARAGVAAELGRAAPALREAGAWLARWAAAQHDEAAARGGLRGDALRGHAALLDTFADGVKFLEEAGLAYVTPAAPAPAPAASSHSHTLVVMRHSIREDTDGWAKASEARWPDKRQRPFDPPISDRHLPVESARLLRPYGITVVVSSPFRRCLQTAGIVARELGVGTVHIDDRLGEWFREVQRCFQGAGLPFAPPTPLPAAEVQAALGEQVRAGRWERRRIDESDNTGFLRRVQEAVPAIAAQHPTESVLLVTHGDIANRYLPEAEYIEEYSYMKLHEAGFVALKPPHKSRSVDADILGKHRVEVM